VACRGACLASNGDGTGLRNGYRSAKPQGKPNFAIAELSLCRRHFCDFVFASPVRAFTSRSSRTLNCPSNLIVHDHPNNRPENRRWG
jgi:hypothetical protein